jgi:hypothetical protein
MARHHRGVDRSPRGEDVVCGNGLFRVERLSRQRGDRDGEHPGK